MNFLTRLFQARRTRPGSRAQSGAEPEREVPSAAEQEQPVKTDPASPRQQPAWKELKSEVEVLKKQLVKPPLGSNLEAKFWPNPAIPVHFAEVRKALERAGFPYEDKSKDDEFVSYRLLQDRGRVYLQLNPDKSVRVAVVIGFVGANGDLFERIAKPMGEAGLHLNTIVELRP